MKNFYKSFKSINNNSFGLEKLSCLGSRRTNKPYSLTILFLLAAILFFNLPSFGQNATEEWILHSKVEGIEIYYTIASCNNHNVVYKKFVNTNSSNKKVSWDEEFWIQNMHIPTHPNGKKTLLLVPGETLENDCNNVKNAECITIAYEVGNSINQIILKYNIYNLQIDSL